MKGLITILLITLIVGCSKNEVELLKNETDIVVMDDFPWSVSRSSNWLVRVNSENATTANAIGFLKYRNIIFASAKMENGTFYFRAKTPLDITEIDFECKNCGIENKKLDTKGGIYDFSSSSSNQRILSVVDTTYNVTDNTGGNLTVDGIDIALQASNYNQVTLKNGGKIVILGTTTIKKLLTNGSSKNDLVIASNGNFILDQGFNSSKIDITNYGEVRIKGAAVFSNNRYLNNRASGAVTIDDQLNNNSSITNYGTIHIKKSLHNNGSSSLYNHCKISVKKDFHQNGTFENNGYLYVEKSTTMNGGGTNIMGANSYISSDKNFTLNGNITSSGEALINAEKDISIGGGVNITGVKFSTPSNSFKHNNSGISNLLEDYSTAMDNLADQGTCGYLYNVSQSPYDLRFPSNGEVTIAFEDMWPEKGDYDFNDLMFTYYITYSIDENDHISSMTIDGEFKAWGGYIKSGVGMRWLTNKQVSGTSFFESSDIVEEGTSNTVIITGNISNEISVFHQGGSLPLTKSFSKTIDFKDNIEASEISNFTIDPFIYHTAERGHEIHLPNYPSTSLCDNTKFNLFDDNSDQSSTWYKSSDNMPWGIELLAGDDEFKVPKESTNIKDAYPSFESWVTSNGVNDTKWYNNSETDKVYNE